MKKIKKVKKRKIRNTILLATILGAINIGFVGCKDVSAITDKISTIENISDIEDEVIELQFSKDDKVESITTESNKVDLQEVTETSVEENKEQENTIFTSYATVTASISADIMDNSKDGNKLGVLPEGKSLRLLEKMDNGWYKVEYYNQEAYINDIYVYESEAIDITSTLKKVCYALEDIKLYLPYSQNGEVVYNEITIPSLECFEIYEEYDSYYLVKTNDYIGYIAKEKTEELIGNFVVVDISDQQLKLYSNNELVLTTPVVTGKPSTPSDIGLFDVDGVDRHRYLNGPGYASWVDIFMYYNGGEGLHDAQYHKCAAKSQHGWREPVEFGGETYLTDGSHGCINMLHDAVMEVSEYVSVGTKVLVKQ